MNRTIGLWLGAAIASWIEGIVTVIGAVLWLSYDLFHAGIIFGVAGILFLVAGYCVWAANRHHHGKWKHKWGFW